MVLSEMIPTSTMEVGNRHIKRCMNKMPTSLWLIGPEKVKATHGGRAALVNLLVLHRIKGN